MRRAIGWVAIVVCCIVPARVAAAEPAAVTIDSRAPSLKEADGGGWTAGLGFTNLGNAKITLAAEPANAADRGCTLSLDKPALPPAEHRDVTVSIPAGCELQKDSFDFRVEGTEAGSGVSFDVTAAPKPEEDDTEWTALRVFPIVLGALLALVAVFYFFWRDGEAKRCLSAPLPHLETTWSFKDSWVSNVTVAAGLLTGIFGSSDVVKALIGEDAESSIALATVGVAVAAAFIGAGPIVLHALKTKDGSHFTVFGMLAASAVTLAGAVGELWIMFRTGRKLELDGLEDKIWVPLALAGALLLLYGFRTLRATLDRGITPPGDPPDSDTIKAAKMIVRALLQREGVEAARANQLATESLDPIAAQPRPLSRAAIL